MKQKIFSLLLVCLLLFCGCRQAGTDGSADDSVPPVSREFTVGEYREALRKATTLKDVHTILGNREKEDIRVKAESMTMLLKDAFFLLPQPDDARVTSVIFDERGYSLFTVKMSHGCEMTVKVYHHAKTVDYTAYKDYLSWSMLTVDGYAVDWYSREKEIDGETVFENLYFVEIDGYVVEISAQSSCECDRTTVPHLGFETLWVDPPRPTNSSPPSIRLNGMFGLGSGTSHWTSRSPEGRIGTIYADALHPAHRYRENYTTILVKKDTPYPVTVTCEYTPEQVTVYCFSMEDEDAQGVSLPVTTRMDEKGNTVYCFEMKTDGFYAYDIMLTWKRFGNSDLAHYSCYSRCEAL